MTLMAKWVDLDVVIGQTADDNLFTKLLLASKFYIKYVKRNDINKALSITVKDDKQLGDCG